jgi:hypothetical protein
LLRWCCHCLRRSLPCHPWLSTCQLNNGEDACKLSAQCKHNKGKDACAVRVIMPAHRGQQCQCDKGDDTSATAQTCQVDGGNNTGAMTVTTPMRHEGKEVSAIRTTAQGQQGRYNARAILAMAPAQRGQRCHSYNSKDTCASMMVMTPL